MPVFDDGCEVLLKKRFRVRYVKEQQNVLKKGRLLYRLNPEFNAEKNNW